LRKQIVPEKSIQVAEGAPINCEPEAKRYGMYWAQRLKRVFNIENCEKCGGRMSAAAATAGLSIVAGSLWDRWIMTAKNPCERLLTKASTEDRKSYEALLR
jgi:hypothetical protein